jgi:hypothetical protein
MVLNTKVDKSGKISTYSSDNKYTLLEFYVMKMIKEVTAEELQNLVNERREEITKAIRTELAKKTTYNKFVDKFIENVADAVNNTWVPKIEIQFEQSRDY